MQYVIVGAGPAGVVAAETLRRVDPQGDITLIGDEPEKPYSRMAIPYLLSENIQEEGTHLRHGVGHYEALGIRLVNDQAAKVNTTDKNITLAGGDTLSYDRLLVATGSRPIKPPVEGIDLPGVHNCWTLEDARHIIQLAKPDSKVLLIGAGFIGCIILEALVRRGVELSVVEMGDRMVPRMMNQTAGNLIKQWCEHKGVKVYTSARVTAIREAQAQIAQPEPAAPADSGGFFQGLLNAIGLGSKKAPAEAPKPAAAPAPPAHRFKVSLDNGVEMDADLVISAAGVKPNMDFLAGSGVDTDQGILVDRYLQTNVADIYAAGDVAQGRDFSTGSFEVQAIQPTATEHGRIAAMNMAGHPTRHQGSVNMNVLDTMGLISSSFGLWMGEEGGDSVEACEADRFRYINLEFKDDVLVGATSLGLTQHVGVLRGLIQGRVPLGEWKDRLMQDPTRIMEAYLAKNHLAKGY